MRDATVGKNVYVRGTWIDPKTRTYVDPQNVFFRVEPPAGGSLTQYQYGDSSGQVVREQQGVYSLIVNLSTVGMWLFRVFSTGTWVDSDVQAINVTDPRI